jgi:hypothetical protein
MEHGALNTQGHPQSTSDDGGSVFDLTDVYASFFGQPDAQKIDQLSIDTSRKLIKAAGARPDETPDDALALARSLLPFMTQIDIWSVAHASDCGTQSEIIGNKLAELMMEFVEINEISRCHIPLLVISDDDLKSPRFNVLSRC